MKYLESIDEFEKWMTVFHRSDDYQHMERGDFSLEKADEESSIFGKALYFASSPDISGQLGKYKCKFKIKLNQPVLNMNKEMTCQEADKLMEDFVNRYNLELPINESDEIYSFSDEYDGVQYGDLFLEMQNMLEGNKYFMDFIRNFLKYDSFIHYCDYGTNFITEKGDYGFCYGIYNPEHIRYVDGPF